MNILKSFKNWKLFFVLLLLSIFSIILVFPYAISLQREALSAISIPMSVLLLLLLSIIQSTILFSIVIFIGLNLSKKLKISKILLIDIIYKKESIKNLNFFLKYSIISGLLTWLLIYLLDLIFIKLGLQIVNNIDFSFWKSFFASFYWWIGEEILLRLFFMTFVVWILSKITKIKEKVSDNNKIMWSSIIISAITFGLFHLPIVANIIDLTPLVIIRTITLNWIWGVIFGRIYWKKSLESAMISHFSADIVLHVIIPLIILKF